jgi:hypothetical protein
MRWQIIEPANTGEAAEREVIIRKIVAWWKTFQAKTDDLSALFSGNSKWDLPDWMHRHFSAIHPRMMWEYGPALEGDGHRLVMTPEAAYHLRPLARAIRKLAPVIPGWEFYEFRLPESLELTEHAVQGRVGCSVSDFKVKVSRGELNRIDLEYSSPSLTIKDEQTGFNAAFVATETLLGERLLNEWIGGIDFKPGKVGGLKGMFSSTKDLSHFLGLDRLKDTVDALVGSIVDQNPPQPHFEWACEETPCTLWELKPEEAEDYLRQDDLLVGRSVHPTMWMSAHSETFFSSRRFSQCGELFCYVKIDGAEGLGDGGFADKSEIEDALDASLKPEKLGCTIGGGTGLRYSYIDLALTDTMKGIQVVRRSLQAGKVPKRSWVQFFDSDWRDEWVGIYSDSPAPPLATVTE